MSDIETAEALAQRIHANHSKQMTQNEIKARDAAIRRQVAEEVLGRVEAIARVLHYPTAEIIAGEVRSEYAPQEKDVKTTTVFVNGGMEKHDAEVARKAKVEVLKDAYGAWLSHPNTTGQERVSDTTRAYWHGLFSRHGIHPHEIEPRKVYTEADIKVECEDESIDTWVIRCGDMGWYEDEWVKYDERDSSVYSKHDAEAIASHLRATKNFPEVK